MWLSRNQSITLLRDCPRSCFPGNPRLDGMRREGEWLDTLLESFCIKRAQGCHPFPEQLGSGSPCQCLVPFLRFLSPGFSQKSCGCSWCYPRSWCLYNPLFEIIEAKTLNPEQGSSVSQKICRAYLWVLLPPSHVGAGQMQVGTCTWPWSVIAVKVGIRRWTGLSWEPPHITPWDLGLQWALYCLPQTDSIN